MLNSLEVGLLIVFVVLLFNLTFFSLSPVILKKLVDYIRSSKVVEK